MQTSNGEYVRALERDVANAQASYMELRQWVEELTKLAHKTDSAVARTEALAAKTAGKLDAVIEDGRRRHESMLRILRRSMDQYDKKQPKLKRRK